MTQEQIMEALSFVIEPDLKKDIVSLGLVSQIQITDGNVSFRVQVSNPAMHSRKRMEEACIHQIQTRIASDVGVRVEVVPLDKSERKDPSLRTTLPGVKHIIAVASGKGGVGKSTVAANLAAGMAKAGYRVGLIDADIYGPSQPIMFDVAAEKPGVIEVGGKQMMTPVSSYGVKILSIGFFVDIHQAIVWRGPMTTKALNQMVNDVHWGELDFLFLDLPPGTGDVHLTIVQSIPLSGAVVVSTPQTVALADARKGVNMFQMPNINVPVLGIIENMAWFTPEELPDNRYYIFGKEGAARLAEELNLPLLAQIPLVQSVRESSDIGRPAVLQEGTPVANAFDSMCKRLAEMLIK
ncbi:MAG: Mrp/NBP35 family ATP-binding protein [Flavobacteriales bacterium]|jgi:ATP-binding protein involved in chromosome partitioning|nr:Mrp/NBP35 family ATP-binding protein [Flavobacteriales bacterium]